MSHGSMLQARVFSSSPCRRMTRYPKPRALVPSGQEARSRAASDSGLVDILGVAIHHFMARGRNPFIDLSVGHEMSSIKLVPIRAFSHLAESEGGFPGRRICGFS